MIICILSGNTMAIILVKFVILVKFGIFGKFGIIVGAPELRAKKMGLR